MLMSELIIKGVIRQLWYDVMDSYLWVTNLTIVLGMINLSLITFSKIPAKWPISYTMKLLYVTGFIPLYL